jgi:CheY-like chemotaxis protein
LRSRTTRVRKLAHEVVAFVKQVFRHEEREPRPSTEQGPQAHEEMKMHSPEPAQHEDSPVSQVSPRPPILAAGDVLIVDDEPMIGATLVRLVSHLGQQAVAVTRAEDALRLVEREPNRFALVVTDMAMPTMTGSELARALRALRPDLRVVLSSGTEFVLAGTAFDDVLPKPYTVHALSEMLRRNLAARHTPPDDEPAG